MHENVQNSLYSKAKNNSIEILLHSRSLSRIMLLDKTQQIILFESTTKPLFCISSRCLINKIIYISIVSFLLWYKKRIDAAPTFVLFLFLTNDTNKTGKKVYKKMMYNRDLS